jgi:signal transduction histidine kinase
VLEISEREQRRIGQDLHDGLCQQLTGISLLSRSLQQQLTGSTSDDANKITTLINECIEQTRQVTRGLHPVPDEPTGLQLALTELAASVSEASRLPCVCECPQPVPIPDQTAATNLYRIAQEAVQNALRHSGATQITIGLQMDERAITLVVRDNGRGIAYPTRSAGLGLDIMRYRADSMGASLEIARADEGGTVITCVLPRKAID